MTNTDGQWRSDVMEDASLVLGSLFKELVNIAGKDFVAFYTLFGLRPESFRVLGKFHEALAQIVDDTAKGKTPNNQMLSAPPQHGKTDVLIRAAMAWLMGYRPGIQLGLASYHYPLVEETSMESRRYVSHPWYQEVFPGLLMDEELCRITNWGTTNGSRLRAVSFGKKLVGRRVDWFIGDDIYPGREEVESQHLRKKVLRWFFADCVTRLSPEAKVFMVGTRWHPEDLQGFLSSEERVKELTLLGELGEVFKAHNFPAIAEPTPKEPDPLGRGQGEPLCPELGRTSKFLKTKKSTLPDYEWQSQFQGRPRPAHGGQVSIEDFIKIPLSQVPTSGLICARGWDLAAEVKKKNDFSAGAKLAWDVARQELYIMDIAHHKLVWPKMRKRLVTIAEDDIEEGEPHPVRLIGVEGVAGFALGYHDIKEALRGKVRVRKKNPKKGVDKLTRAMSWFVLVEAKRVFLVEGAWNKKFLDELEVFPVGEHDDQVDAVSIAFEMVTRSLGRLARNKFSKEAREGDGQEEDEEEDEEEEETD